MSDEVTTAEEMTIETQWHGPTPFFLVIQPDDQSNGNVGIDLDESLWATKYADFMRAPGLWVLVHKESQQPVFMLLVEEGDQPYFVKRHVGHAMTAKETIAFGIGKKCSDGTMVRLWLLPNGSVCGGDDVNRLASKMV